MSLGRVDRYELLQLIGQGSFGGVYRARHVHTGQINALKLARDTVDPDGTARVLAEARAAASLRHPNVVGIIDGGIAASGEAFIVMELLEGSTLAQVIAREGPLPPARAIRIARQMLDGLAAAHANGIIHRDVKPSNVFITNASDVTGGDMIKVIDFGISKIALAGVQAGMTLPGVAMGTPGYMAPEQLGDARSVDGRADVYAVGATLFEMLTKRRPIEFDTFEAWMRRLMSERAPPLASVAPHVPPLLAAAVDRALARDADARWPSAGAMRDALDAAFSTAHEGFAPTAFDTPRAVVQSTFPSTSSWPSSPSGSPPPTPSPLAGSAMMMPVGVAPTHGSYAPQARGTAPYPMQQHPPQIAQAASTGSSTAMMWVIGGLVLFIGFLGVGGAVLYVLVLRVPDAAVAARPTVAPPATAPATVAAPAVAPNAPAAAQPVARAGAAAAVQPKPGAAPSVPDPSSPSPGAPAPAPAAGGKVGNVRISPPQIVGELRQDQFMSLAGRARSAIEQCNPDRRALVIKVDIMIGNKRITIAQPSVNTNPGDPLIARCVAQSLKDAQGASFAPGDSGIYKEAQFTWQ